MQMVRIWINSWTAAPKWQKFPCGQLSIVAPRADEFPVVAAASPIGPFERYAQAHLVLPDDDCDDLRVDNDHLLGEASLYHYRRRYGSQWYVWVGRPENDGGRDTIVLPLPESDDPLPLRLLTYLDDAARSEGRTLIVCHAASARAYGGLIFEVFERPEW